MVRCPQTFGHIVSYHKLPLNVPTTHTNTVEIHTYCNPQVFNLIMDNFKKKIKISSDNGMGYVVQSQNVASAHWKKKKIDQTGNFHPIHYCSYR